MILRRLLLVVLVLLGFGPACRAAPQAMVAAANPMAVEAGLEVLRRGGSAVDAAIAVQMVLGVVEPQASGIGGGGFLLHYDAATSAIAVYDGRETAPDGASPTMFLGADGKPIGMLGAVLSGISVGVPGAVAMLELAHKEHGKLGWRELFQPAIDTAREGFAVPPRLAGWLQRMPTDDPDIRAVYFNADGSTKKQGERIANPALAETMRLIAEQGARAFYEGDIAREIVEREHKHVRPGTLSPADLANYKPIRREPVCGPQAASPSCRCWACSNRSSCGATSPTTCARSISSPRQAGWPSPTATAMSPTRRSSRCLSPACCRRPISPSAAS